MSNLLIEQTDASTFTESIDGKKVMKITGKFLLKNKKNRNGRIYPGKVMDAAVKKYVNDYIKTNRALGELNHPDRVTIDPERACILIEDLQEDGDYYVGVAKVLSTPLGQLLQNLLEDGVKIGVSSRGIGSISKKDGVVYVKDDYEIRTAADIVFDPSVADAFVDVLMEDVEYLKYGNILVEKDLYESRQRIRSASMTKLEEQKLKEFQSFLNKISRV